MVSELGIAPRIPSEDFHRQIKTGWEVRKHLETVTDEEYSDTINNIKSEVGESSYSEITESLKEPASVILTRYWKEKLNKLLRTKGREKTLIEEENKFTLKPYRPLSAYIENEPTSAWAIILETPTHSVTVGFTEDVIGLEFITEVYPQPQFENGNDRFGIYFDDDKLERAGWFKPPNRS
jgi:hypothetical protein